MRTLEESEIRTILAKDLVIPELIIRSVLANPGSSITQVQKRIEHAAIHRPQAADIDLSLDWFFRRGDIYYARASFVWPTPSAVIADQVDSETVRYVSSGAMTSAQAASIAGSSIPIQQVNQGEAVLGFWFEWEGPSSLGMSAKRVPVIDLDDLENDLDTIAELVIPPIGNVQRIDLPGGDWEVFTDHGWDPSASSGRLQRWKSEQEERTVRRYYVQCSDGQLLEIPWDDAAMWRFKLSTESSGQIDLETGRIRLAHPLPQTYGLWLAGVGGEFISREGPSEYNYFVPSERRRRVLEALNTKLGIGIRES